MEGKEKLNAVLYMPDGNRRYAKKNNLSLDVAYSEGVKTLKIGSEFFLGENISKTFIYHAMSDYTHKRTDLSLEPIYEAFRTSLEDLRAENFFENNSISFRTIDHSGCIPKDLLDIANEIEASTKNFDKNLFVLLGYSLKQDYNNSIANNPENYNDLRRDMLFPDINLVLRPKEMRASMGPVYAMGQSHMITMDKLNPEVKKEDFRQVMQEYNKLNNYRVEHSHNPIHKDGS